MLPKTEALVVFIEVFYMFYRLVKTIFLRYHIIFSSLLIANVVLGNSDEIINSEIASEISMINEKDPSQKIYVHKFVLENGMTVLVYPSHVIPKVSLQIWYDVGSKDEITGEKGIAHLIEHMIFKGTDSLSESDINVVVHKLSGNCNAFTSYDYTGYLFNFPTNHWKEALPIMADCMENCTFKDDMLNSEMKAVIQELKMNKDHYQRALAMEVMGMIFAGHPYQYPVIGYKQDLWSVSGADLKAFYKKHYKPNNATLVVVGDVDVDEVFTLAKEYFGPIESNSEYKKREHYFNNDITSKSVTLFRDIQQPFLMLAFTVPGAREKCDYLLGILEYVIGKGRSSRLYKKLVDETQLATSVSTGFWDLFDHSLFFIMVDPKNVQDISKIEQIVTQELNDLSQKGLQQAEFERGLKKSQMAFYSLLEDIEDEAYVIGHTYLATGDENYIFTALQQPQEVIYKQAQEIISAYFRPTVMNKGFVLPLPESEKKEWAVLQKESDDEDQRILSARVRTTEVEPEVYAKTVEIHDPKPFNFPKALTFTLSNGLKVLYHDNSTTPKINIILQLKARSYYDPADKEGLYNFVSSMLLEGTKNYSGEQLADAIESRGMSLNVFPGGVGLRMLSSDFEFGLEILQEVLTQATFPEDKIEKVRQQILADIKQFWDEPRSFIGQVVRQNIYKGHPYSKQVLGTKESILSISREDLLDFYKKCFSPQQAHIAIVGDLKNINMSTVLERKIGSWQGDRVEDILFPSLVVTKGTEINYPINRDQVVLALANLSINRTHPDFDKYLLFDQIFGGGALGSLSSRLFQLREQTGLFYSVNGTLLAGADEQPGMFQVRTTVSLDRLKEAEQVIKNTIDTVIDTLTEQDHEEAQRAVINTLIDNFASNNAIAQTFLYLDRFNLSADYFDNRAAQLKKITLDDMKTAIKTILVSNNLYTVRVGRV